MESKMFFITFFEWQKKKNIAIVTFKQAFITCT